MANDGEVSFLPTPHNRWTAYQSPDASDWVEIDFGEPQQVSRVELAVFGDGGEVQAPKSYTIPTWDGASWLDVNDQSKTPAVPAGSEFSEVRFPPLQTSRLRVVLTHRGRTRSGLPKILVCAE